MKKTKLNPKHLYAIFAFLLSAVVAFCGVQIWQEYSIMNSVKICS